MRSFKSKVLSAVAFAAAGFAAALPSHGEVARLHNEPLQLDVQQNYAQATFSVPCAGCSGQDYTDQDDESLTLNFTAHSHDEACGSSNITINGVPLPQEWEGDYASGSGSYQYTSIARLQQNDQLPQRDLALAWNSTCLHGNAETDEAAQILTVNIKSIDGVPISTPSGFTISFKQNASPPSLLRLETVPDLAPELSDIWRDPPAHLRLVFGHAATAETSKTNVSLEDEIRELRALQAELAAIQLAVASKKQYINSKIRKEAKCSTEELKHCDGISCVLKTVADKAHGAWRVVYLRLHPDDQFKNMGRPEEVYASARVSSQRYGSINVANIDSKAETEEEESKPQPYEGSTGELPLRSQQRQAPYIIALEIALGVLCCGCLVAVIRHKCSSLRTRTERAADYEERYNARAYKRAARHHAWRNWWRGNWRKDAARIADYEEKRALIADQENVLETAMQEEIRQLRVAHNVVNDIIRAEEGRTGIAIPPNPRCVCHRPCFAPGPPSLTSTYPPSTIPEAPSRPLSRTDSLPSYRSRTPSEPPLYESDLGASFVANGLRYEARARAYTASASSQAGESGRWTPDSSVVDVSPRPSAETLRHPQSIFTLDESESESEL
ncbi:uncharacterized protein M421DRAFT_419242 [Didymella exigua CBS 183.55]|uniref:Uncharacterized protein n=1 Tax=Didymella exigua CBS 183.55 TaxID=1150837 RepID=A0A6A5RSV2_9PLEO|nr:uncharacterized protein M421DRAFT_419242 [Didymella exigua CBS 183.55]KAF1930194.1 hypothetical protein M421DRAFT_419242 [Didymella exigua CBS 183.55]